MSWRSAIDVAGYTLLDDAANWIRETVTSTPYLVLIVIAAGFVALFIFGVIKKLMLFSILMAVFGLAIIGLWMYSGHSVSIG